MLTTVCLQMTKGTSSLHILRLQVSVEVSHTLHQARRKEKPTVSLSSISYTVS